MTPVGEALRRERLKRNLGLEQVSKELKISPRMLEAIEAEEFDKLPGAVFAKSFVRQYARVLGLDEEDLAASVGRKLAPGTPVRQAEGTAAVSPAAGIQLARVEAWQSVGGRRIGMPSWVRPLVLLLLVMLLCSGVYTYWQREGRLTPAAASHAPRPAVRQVASRPEPSPIVKAAATTAPVEQPPSSPPATAEVSPASPAVLRSSQVTGEHGAVEVDLSVSEPAWVLVRSDGQYMYSGVLEAGQKRTVEGAANIYLQVGNAGGVSIALNGKPIGEIGGRGDVRTVQFTSGGFQIGAASKAPPAGDPLF